MFKVDGVTKIFDNGLTEYDENAFGSLNETYTVFFAMLDEMSGGGDTFINLIRMYLSDVLPGEYSNVSIYYYDEAGTSYYLDSNSLTVISTGEVDGAIGGTLSGTSNGRTFTRDAHNFFHLTPNTFH